MLPMKVTLAIALAVVLSAGFTAAQSQKPEQQQTAPAEHSQPGAAPQEQGTPTLSAPPCAPSKDTCELTEPEQPPSTPVQNPEKKGAAAAASKTEVHKKKKSHRHRTVKKTAVASDPSGPKKTIVRQGGTSDPSAVLAPGPKTPSSYSRQMTADLLSATDANLKEACARPLTGNQEETVNQIKVFMEQANDAIKAGDLDRGHNLATKAHLLSDDLVKH